MKKKGIGNRLMAWLLLVIMTLQVTGVNSAIPVYADDEELTTIATSKNQLGQVAVDGSGSVYVVEYQTGNVVKMNADGSIITTISTGLDQVSGLAVDSNGNIYVSSLSTNSIIKMDADGGNPSTIATGLNGPNRMAVDNSGNIYVTDTGNSQIKKIEAGNGTVTTIGSGFQNPRGLTVDNAGNIYVADTKNNVIKKMDADGNNITVIGPGFLTPEGVAVDSSGNIYVYENGSITIKKMDKDGSNNKSILDLSSLMGFYFGISGDSAGNVYVSYASRRDGNYCIGKIKSSTPSTDSVVNALSLNSLVTPPSIGAAPDTATIDQTQYTGTVAWYEADGTTPVSGNFAPSTVYKALVTLTAKSGYTLTGVAQNSFTYTGASNVTNSADSGTVTITFPVTAISNDATLRSLSLSAGSLTPAFVAGTTRYTVNVDSSTDKITLTPTVNESHATITVIGASVTSGTASPAISLATGNNTITVFVTAQNGTKNTYTITVNRAATPSPSDSVVNALSLNSLVTPPSIGAAPDTATIDQTQYTGTVSWYEENGTPLVNGNFAPSTVYKARVRLTAKSGYTFTGVLQNSFTYTGASSVTNNADSGTVWITFPVTAISNDATLRSLSLSAGSLTPAFAAGTTRYTVNVDSSTDKISLTPTVNESHATIRVINEAVTSGTASPAIPLVTGKNYIPVFVTAQNGISRTYLIVVNREETPSPADSVVNALSLNSLVTPPSIGAVPDTATIDQTQYTGTVAWYEADGITPVNGNFAPSTVYKALVTLTAKSGYTLTGVAQNSFTYTGASNITNSADSGTVTITFPSTKASGSSNGGRNTGTNISGAGTPNVISDGLNALFTNEDAQTISNGGSVKIDLNIARNDNSENASIVTNTATKDLMEIGLILDIDLLKTITDASNAVSRQNINDTGSNLVTLTVPIPDGLKGKAAYAVYRYHEGNVNKLTAEPNENGEYARANEAKDTLTIAVSKFSTYAIGYMDSVVTPARDNSFYPLCLTAKASRTSQKLSFKKVTGADGYEISSGICGKSRSKTAEVSSDTTTYTIRNLKKDTYYKFKVSAYKVVNGQKIIIARSQLIHSTTLSTKHTNPAKVTVDVKNVTLKVKKSKQLICDTIAASDLKVNLHEAKIRYESSDRSIAKVSSRGKITAVGKGSCVVFAYAQNGIYQKINITVK